MISSHSQTTETRPPTAVQRVRMLVGERRTQIALSVTLNSLQFEHWRDSEGLWSRAVESADVVCYDEEDVQGINADDILKYPLNTGVLFDSSGYDAPRFSPTEHDTASKWPLRALCVYESYSLSCR